MPIPSVSFSSGGPTRSSPRLYFCRMLLCVTPLAEAFEIVDGIVHKVAISMMDLAASCLTASLAWPWFNQPSSGLACAASGFCIPKRVEALGPALTRSTAIGEFRESVTHDGPSLSVMVVLILRAKQFLTHGTCFHSVLNSHFSTIILHFTYRVDTASIYVRASDGDPDA